MYSGMIGDLAVNTGKLSAVDQVKIFDNNLLSRNLVKCITFTVGLQLSRSNVTS